MDWRLTGQTDYLIVQPTKWSKTLATDSVRINSNLGSPSFDSLQVGIPESPGRCFFHFASKQ